MSRFRSRSLKIHSMIGYLYDASGHRVAEGTITSMSCDPSKNGFTTTTQEKDYILDQSGAVETVLTMAQGGAMQWDHSNIYAKGELVGAYTQTGLHFYLHDWQGTVRAVTDYAGVVEETCPSLPFGDTLGVQQNSACPQQDSFAGLSGSRQTRLDDAVWRSYSPATGRWMSPDPYNGSYSLTNPQSFDRYAYVGNNPLGFTNPSGLDPGCSSASYAEGLDNMGLPLFSTVCYFASRRLGGDAIALLVPHLAGIIPFVGWSMVATEFIGRLAGWFGPPQFHGSLKPRPGTPESNCNLITPASALSSPVHYRVAADAVAYFRPSFAKQIARGAYHAKCTRYRSCDYERVPNCK